MRGGALRWVAQFGRPAARRPRLRPESGWFAANPATLKTHTTILSGAHRARRFRRQMKYTASTPRASSTCCWSRSGRSCRRWQRLPSTASRRNQHHKKKHLSSASLARLTCRQLQASLSQNASLLRGAGCGWLTLARLTALAILRWLLRWSEVLPRLWIFPIEVQKSVRR